MLNRLMTIIMICMIIDKSFKMKKKKQNKKYKKNKNKTIKRNKNKKCKKNKNKNIKKNKSKKMKNYKTYNKLSTLILQKIKEATQRLISDMAHKNSLIRKKEKMTFKMTMRTYLMRMEELSMRMKKRKKQNKIKHSKRKIRPKKKQNTIKIIFQQLQMALKNKKRLIQKLFMSRLLARRFSRQLRPLLRNPTTKVLISQFPTILSKQQWKK